MPLRAVQSSELPLPALRRQAPRWVRGWVGDPGARSRTPPTSAPFAKKAGSKTKTRSRLCSKPRVLQAVTEARCSREAPELPVMDVSVRGGRLGVVWSPQALVASTEAT
jgi:hypothetical protein